MNIMEKIVEKRKNMIAYSEKVTGVADLSDKDRRTFYIYRIILYVILFILFISSSLIIYLENNHIIIHKIINIILFLIITFDMISVHYLLSNNIIIKLFFNKNSKKS